MGGKTSGHFERVTDDKSVAIQALENLAPWRAEDRAAWVRVGMALHSVSDDLFGYWDRWSSQCAEKYTHKGCVTAWRGFRPRADGVSIASLVEWAKKDSPGWNPIREDREHAQRRSTEFRLVGNKEAPESIEPEPKRPDIETVQELWDESVSVTEHVGVRTWLSGRGIDPSAVDWLDLARAIPEGAPCPEWAHVGQSSWASGWPLVVPLRDEFGEMRSLHARAIDSRNPKSASPRGHTLGGLVMACPLGRVLLSNGQPEWCSAPLFIVEGAVDYLKMASRVYEEDEDAPSVISVVSGSWGEPLVSRFRSGLRVFSATDEDEAGERYSREILSSFSGRGIATFRTSMRKLMGEMCGN